jgi:hypothetical protein
MALGSVSASPPGAKLSHCAHANSGSIRSWAPPAWAWAICASTLAIQPARLTVGRLMFTAHRAAVSVSTIPFFA